MGDCMLDTHEVINGLLKRLLLAHVIALGLAGLILISRCL